MGVLTAFWYVIDQLLVVTSALMLTRLGLSKGYSILPRMTFVFQQRSTPNPSPTPFLRNVDS